MKPLLFKAKTPKIKQNKILIFKETDLNYNLKGILYNAVISYNNSKTLI